MRIIPVMDLLDGQVVHARRGERSSYRPVATRLAPDPGPSQVLAGLLSLAPFDTIYLADLNALQHKGDNAAALRRLCEAFPGVNFWLDAGERSADFAAPRVRPVLGTETGSDPVTLAANCARHDAVLSLDFAGEDLLGDPAILEASDSWPRDVIVMNLMHIGTANGPALTHCRRIRELCGIQRRVFLGGGFRHAEDLRAASGAGASGALIATALHDGSLDAAAWMDARLKTKKTPA